ncbi:hypothetical protein A2U01_0016028, partial [Trifolium medium]|nr:hypothetical protein [Trifolium medium]
MAATMRAMAAVARLVGNIATDASTQTEENCEGRSDRITYD